MGIRPPEDDTTEMTRRTFFMCNWAVITTKARVSVTTTEGCRDAERPASPAAAGRGHCAAIFIIPKRVSFF